MKLPRLVVTTSLSDRRRRLQDDLLDVSLALARAVTTGPERHSLDSVLRQFGYSREELRESTDE